MALAKSLAVAGALLCVTQLSQPAAALPQPIVGAISCDVVLDYVDTSPPSYAAFLSFLQGYAAGAQDPSALGANDADGKALFSRVLGYCRTQPKADFASAVAAILKK